jgi:glycosyltransferase involved in cell wall biosynthesis
MKWIRSSCFSAPRRSLKELNLKKEIFILSSEPPEQLGGMEACVREQVVGFQKRGYDVRVFHRKNSGPEWFRRNVRRVTHHLTDTLAGFFIGRAAQKAMHSDVAAIFSHATVGWYPLRVPDGCKQFHIYHGTYRGQAKAIRRFISYLGYLKLTWWDSMVLERMSGRGKQIFVVSELIRVEVKKLFGYESITLGNPLDMSEFRPMNQAASRAKFGIPSEGVVGVFVGTTQPNKNFPIVQRLIQELPHVYWVLALRGGADGLNGLGKSVRVLPDVSRAEIPELYSAADFSVCPSRYDPFPYVVPEALACGLPVLSGLNGGRTAVESAGNYESGRRRRFRVRRKRSRFASGVLPASRDEPGAARGRSLDEFGQLVETSRRGHRTVNSNGQSHNA